MRYVAGHLAAPESVERDVAVCQPTVVVLTIAIELTCSRKILNASFCASSILSLVWSIVLASTDHFCEGISSSRCGTTGVTASTHIVYERSKCLCCVIEHRHLGIFPNDREIGVSASFRYIDQARQVVEACFEFKSFQLCSRS
jgi:hypothetical protein